MQASFSLDAWKPFGRKKDLIFADYFLRHGSCCGFMSTASCRLTCMKRIEAIIERSALDDFHRCAKELGILGFDLSATKTSLCLNQRSSISGEPRSVRTSRIKVDFAVLDEQTKATVHAVLETVHLESIGIFKFDEDPNSAGTTVPLPSPA